MHTSTEIMQTIVKNDLIRHFSTYDGWTIHKPVSQESPEQILTISRKKGGQIEQYLVGVTFAPNVPKTFIERLNSLEKETSNNTRTHGKAFLVPGNTDATEVPDGIAVYRMRHFVYKDDILVWLKKPERMERTKQIRNEDPIAL